MYWLTSITAGTINGDDKKIKWFKTVLCEIIIAWLCFLLYKLAKTSQK